MGKRSVLLATATAVALAAITGKAGASNGLHVPDGATVWPQWQARLTLSTAVWTPFTLTLPGDTGARQVLQSGSLLGDYYFDMPGLRLPASVGGLRASSGLLIGPRGLAQGVTASLRSGSRFGLSVQSSAAPFGDGATDAVPYLGLGYTGLALKGGLSVTADLGLVAERPSGAGRVGRALLGTQGLDSALRELRLSPVLQLGVSYAF